MRVTQRFYEGLIFFLSLLNCVKIVFYGNKYFELASLIVTIGVLLFLFFESDLINIESSILTVLFVLTSLSLTILLKGGAGTAVNYLIIMLSSMLFSSYGISRRKIRNMFAVNGFILLLFLLLLKREEHYSFYSFKTFLGQPINSNMVGMISLMAFFFLFYVGINIEDIGLRIVYFLPVFIVCTYFFVISECRSIFLALILFFLFYIFKRSKFNESSLRTIIFISQICSFLFVIFYIFLYRSEAELGLGLFGKTFFSGRQIVWESAFNVFFEHPFIGAGNSVYLNGVGDSFTRSAHNTVMSILYVFGLLPTVCFYLFFGKKYDRKTIYRTSRFSQFVVISTLIITFLESFYMESYLGFLFMLFHIIEFVDMKDKNGYKIRECL